MAIRVLVNGAFGRMGQLTVETIKNSPLFDLVGQTGREYNLKNSIIDSRADVVVDFTCPEDVFDNSKTIIESGSRPVIGTSGLTLEQIDILKKECKKKKLGGMVVPNFSLGAMLMMKSAKVIAKYMPQVEIIEFHHPQKKDAPSGTARRTAELIKEGRSKDFVVEEDARESRGLNYGGVRIHSIRLPGTLAHQEIIFGNEGETLTLRNDSIDRKAFSPGICLACEKVMELDELIYGLEEIL